MPACSASQPPVNIRHAFGQAEDVVDDRVSNVAVQVLQLGLGFAIDRDAKRRDAARFCLDQGFTNVLTGVTGIAIIVVVRTAVSQDD